MRNGGAGSSLVAPSGQRMGREIQLRKSGGSWGEAKPPRDLDEATPSKTCLPCAEVDGLKAWDDTADNADAERGDVIGRHVNIEHIPGHGGEGGNEPLECVCGMHGIGGVGVPAIYFAVEKKLQRRGRARVGVQQVVILQL